ncbi:X-linked nuclear protein [Operophtera brumata]|uniref:X-linked nuclear protein n=1 Tax=Operophtera brumata TaxID=104452 RepID=A0A0L7LLK7_OPEBR|nr:X-linked nuclear protein [Operophtera brumata]
MESRSGVLPARRIVPNINARGLPRSEHDGCKSRHHFGHLVEPGPRHTEHIQSLSIRTEKRLLHIPPCCFAVGIGDVALLRVARDAAIHAVHEHDSLLRGSGEQGLPEHERAAAWNQFQQEHEHKRTYALCCLYTMVNNHRMRHDCHHDCTAVYTMGHGEQSQNAP